MGSWGTLETEEGSATTPVAAISAWSNVRCLCTRNSVYEVIASSVEKPPNLSARNFSSLHAITTSVMLQTAKVKTGISGCQRVPDGVFSRFNRYTDVLTGILDKRFEEILALLDREEVLKQNRKENI